MKLLDKILFIQKSFTLSDKDFCKKFSIKLKLFLNWKENHSNPTPNDVVFLCEKLNLDFNDFINDDSSVNSQNIKPGEHLCKLNPQTRDRNDVIYEDFAREDNSRYEEKD